MDMITAANMLQMLAAGLALAGLLTFAVRPRQTSLSIIWMLFCGALAMGMTRHTFGDQLGVLDFAFAMGSGGTCSMFYLVSRALFREKASIGLPQLVIVGLIILPGVVFPWLELGAAQSTASAPAFEAIESSMRNLQLMFSSTILVLAFWEGVRGWTDSLPTNERRLRMMYLSVYGMCVSVCTIWQAQPESSAFF